MADEMRTLQQSSNELTIIYICCQGVHPGSATRRTVCEEEEEEKRAREQEKVGKRGADL